MNAEQRAEWYAKTVAKGLVVGAKVRLKRDVERFPQFIARAGMTGTVDYVEQETATLDVKMDQHLPGAEEWKNCVCWYDEGDFADDVFDDLEVI